MGQSLSSETAVNADNVINTDNANSQPSTQPSSQSTATGINGAVDQEAIQGRTADSATDKTTSEQTETITITVQDVDVAPTTSVSVADDATKQDPANLLEGARRRMVISDKSKAFLAQELLKVQVENRESEILKARSSAFITKAVFTAQESNISDLALENKMLRESVDKYKNLYFNLCKSLDNLRKIVESHNSAICDPDCGEESEPHQNTEPPTGTSERTNSC
ncbi:hypothetical protein YASMINEVIRUS_1345 [Yasminevirus sp. GU-2018]|uniref:Uncharacterized protein n=1 Tax=Yasminevirus sp. GU-2018 TaxID=2420051 RepID=A0A5K0UB79_9VIRU|nr:hypothetical protein YASMINEVIRUS_1345 [Yasminevirus sp. GU-2018]